MATKPKRTASSKAASADSEVPPDIRTEWTAVAAYYLAEQRGFEEGHELDDWLRAEQELNDRIMGPDD